MDALGLVERNWDKLKEIVLDYHHEEDVEIWVFYPKIKEFNRILDLIEANVSSLIAMQIDNYSYPDAKKFTPKIKQKMEETIAKGSSQSLKGNIVEHDFGCFYFSTFNQFQDIFIQMVFGLHESFPIDWSEEEHKKTLSIYMEFADKIRGNQKDVKCMLLGGTTGVPEEKMNDDNVFVW
jgi:hypothetical protein